ncbi:biotin/acetyl-CoA-carboxylase ligase [Thermodesulfatator indicus DSM 15286]|uniref:Biotin/acetyl-CoA-carboxylase ligase n=1 Tax=Thermodesulfatator indicus (strain DSM 15286 / JCM 11887 / CIR29812) TaxID=667014 RepID=F8ACC6_THEID|nr:biotin--[acetyl-CoA-carboxylase] ligase [Thermodesulfatator indicus]AEH45764.1 biotin/acetyl-CoA-carboxylase ligase [Thermodesulfatator indicus DSM 15286]
MKRLVGLEEEISFLLKNFSRIQNEAFYGFPAEEIWRRGEEIGQEILVFERLPRAMNFLRQKIKEDRFIKNGLSVMALEMTAAKGRFTRTWVASKGGLWLSLTLYDDLIPETKGWLPIIIGFALTETVQAYGIPARQKWINDVWINKKKLAGVLIEKNVCAGESWYLVGVGLNVNNFLPPGLPAISLKELLGEELSLLEVAAKFLLNLRKYWGLLKAYEIKLIQEESLKNPLPEIFKKFSDTIGRYVAFGEDLTAKEEGRGLVAGINHLGHLLIELPSGSQIELFSGEIQYL